VLRTPFDAGDLQHLAEQAARTVATFMGSDAAPPPVRGLATPPAALALILQARYEARRDRRKLPEAIALCRQALEIAPGHPRAEAALATCQAQHAFYAARLEASLLDDAAAHAIAALAADHDLAEAHFARAHVELHRGRPLIAAVCFRAAISRAPLMAEAHEWLGRMLLEAGFGVDARPRLDEAFADGFSAAVEWQLVLGLALDERWAEVDRRIAQLRGAAVNDFHGHRLRLASWRGRLADAREAYAAMVALPPEVTFERELFLALYDPDRPWPEKRAEILATVDDRTRPSARRRAYLCQLAAEAAGLAGDADTCLGLLLRGNADGLFDLPWLVRCPALASVRAEPRFAVIRNDVAARAEAVHEALFGEHKDQATVATAPPPGQARRSSSSPATPLPVPVPTLERYQSDPSGQTVQAGPGDRRGQGGPGSQGGQSGQGS
jgi:serine/threonine-protein kinase